ncbi:MAG: hypothetical protein ACRCWB_08270 [Enterovibrio sp.]
MDSALEVGTRSGFQTPVLAHLAKSVYSVERVKLLHMEAQNVYALHADIATNIVMVGKVGKKRPICAMIVTAAGHATFALISAAAKGNGLPCLLLIRRSRFIWHEKWRLARTRAVRLVL